MGRKIDAHQHFWNFDPVEFGWLGPDMAQCRRDFRPADLFQELQNTGINGCIAVQARQTLSENDYLLNLASENQIILGVVGWLDIQSEAIEEQIEKYKSNKKFIGVRHILQEEPDGYMLDSRFLNGVKRVGLAGLTYDLLVREHQLEESISFVSQLPNVKIVLDHIGKPNIKRGSWFNWAEHIKKIARFDNVYCKLSGMSFEADWSSWNSETLRPYIHHVIDCFGAGRCMFGSDWPVCLAAGSYLDTFDSFLACLSDLSPEEIENILGNTAAEFYGI